VAAESFFLMTPFLRRWGVWLIFPAVVLAALVVRSATDSLFVVFASPSGRPPSRLGVEPRSSAVKDSGTLAVGPREGAAKWSWKACGRAAGRYGE